MRGRQSSACFPSSIDDADGRIGDSSIVDIYSEDEKSVRIKSGNIMGFVGRNNQLLKYIHALTIVKVITFYIIYCRKY